MDNHATTIFTQRLALIPLSPDFLRVSIERQQVDAERLLGISIHPDWYSYQALMAMRLGQLQNDPTLQPWLLRAIALQQPRQMVGHLGFHTAPGPEYLSEIAPDGVEFGYTVYEPFRRQGYAREASNALMQWAHDRHDVTEFVVTIRPDNIASIQLSEGFGFERVGFHIDEVDGLEDIYKLEYGSALRSTEPDTT